MDAQRKIVMLGTALLLAGSLLLPALAAAGSGSVSVSFRVNPAVTAEVVAEGLLIRSNAPWSLVAETGGDAVAVSGDATGAAGTLVHMDDLTGYSLVLESPR